MGYEPVSPLYPSVGGERCLSFFPFPLNNSVHFCFVSLCTPALVIVMGKEGVHTGTINKKTYELDLYLKRSDV